MEFNQPIGSLAVVIFRDAVNDQGVGTGRCHRPIRCRKSNNYIETFIYEKKSLYLWKYQYIHTDIILKNVITGSAL